MPKVMFEGQEFDIPESASTETLIERLGTGDANLIRHSLNGTEELLPHGQRVHLNDGDRLSAISRFRTGAIIRIDGHQISVPDGTTIKDLYDIRDYLTRNCEDRVPSAYSDYWLYEKLPNGQQRIYHRGEAHEVKDGQHFGTIDRFIVCGEAAWS